MVDGVKDKISSRLNIIKKVVDYRFIGLLLVGNLILVWRFFSLPFSFVFSAPVVPVLSRVVGVVGVDYDSAVRFVLLVFFIFGPISLYLLVKEVTGRRMSALVAAVMYSLPVFRSRFEALVFSGDGAHIAALTLIPLVAFWLLRFLKRGSFTSAVGASICILLVALTSPFGLFVFFPVALVVTFSEMLLGSGRVKFFRFILVVVFSVGLSAFWYNPEFVRLSLFSPSGRVVIAAIKNLIPISFFILPILGTFGFLIFDKRPHLQPLFIALGLTVMFGLLSFAGGLAKYAVSAQSRYLPEVAMSISFIWGVVGTFIYELVGNLPKSKWFPVPMEKRELVRRGIVIAFMIATLVAVVAFPYREEMARRSKRLVAGVTGTLDVDIGEVRDSTGGIHKIIGYSISSLTILVMGWMYRLLRKGERS